ncbi:MAG: DUF418 domain-containing protein [Erythrobacter sp.]|uniref:DUF418 domain-containing protein n=1 Tax=Erythrobacter sp. TaxID=1042 RepID=UPI00262079D8|nr:DUF418 domain-containing protein [Erythrobacter sp.]MDJ0977295.1 DUF418 domain-containing protein [Erythrobacter sp.]
MIANQTAEVTSHEMSTDRSSAPTTSARLGTLDVLRGVAVLMIFVVNIKMMANGYNHYVTRSLWEGEVAAWIAFVQGEFIHGQFVTIFTALFGAGLALLLARDNPVQMRVVLRRLFWLAVFGGLHLIFLREGDILIWYALVGFLAVPFAQLRAVTLLGLGFALQIAAYTHYTLLPIAEPGPAAVLWSSASQAHLEVADIMLGSVGDQVSARLHAAWYYMIDLFLVGGVWIDTLGVMLIGMGLLKTGFLSGELSLNTYAILAVAGLIVAASEHVLPLLAAGESELEKAVLNVSGYAHRFGGALVWSSLIVAAVSAGWQAKALAAAGRTAFTVYILQSVIGLALFSGLGLGLFGQLSLGGLMLITIGVWAFFLIAAPLWLARYRFGPFEWVWRSLTYGRRQSFRLVSSKRQ